MDAPGLENSYMTLQASISKLTESQCNMIAKFDFLTKTVEELRKIMTQFSVKVVALEDAGVDRKKLKGEIKVLKGRIDELFAIVKEGKEEKEDSSHSDVQDVESCHSTVSSSSKDMQNEDVATATQNVTMTTGIDRDTIRSAYEDVRADTSLTEWAVFKFEGARIMCSARGSDFTEFRTQFSDDERAFGYLRLQTGDEMSKRKKFLFVTWVGPNVSVINRAKMSTDKAIIKDIISNFAVELQLENQSEIDIDQFKDALGRAGGANYGTGIRE